MTFSRSLFGSLLLAGLFQMSSVIGAEPEQKRTSPSSRPNQKRPEVSVVMSREDVLKFLIETESLAYASNSIGNDGVATGVPDPVLLRYLREPMAGISQPDAVAAQSLPE